MKTLSYYLVIGIIISILFSSCQNKESNTKHNSTTLEIKNDAYYINGEKTFISALGYQVGARPGQNPKEDDKILQLSRMRNDLKIIKEAGFNTIRTWDELTEEELHLVQESGLYIIYGIEVNQYGEWKNPEFIENAHQRVKKALAYTKNYDCVITYLIMNEPMTGHIKTQGAEAALNLWTGIVDIIHEEHPGIPVSMSPNSRISEWLHESFLDVNAFNIYNYIEDQIYSQGFGPHIEYLREMNGKDKPFLITEFGMSVSPNGNHYYGGNTRKIQAEWVINDYSQILDGGVSGACPFYYADGWWKAGKPEIHDPFAEEWFGFRGYSDINDTIGYSRPVWYEISKYVQAIITAPRNGHIYSNQVPVEIFLTPKISQVKVIHEDKVIFDQKNISSKHFIAQLDFGQDSIKDRELVFEFLNSKGELIKYESIMLLTSIVKPNLPGIKVEVNNKDLSKINTLNATIIIKNASPFTLDKELKYVFSPHIGWEAGINKTKHIQTEEYENIIKVKFDIPENSPLINVSAGIDIKYGKFIKRISDVKYAFKGNWADPIRVKN